MAVLYSPAAQKPCLPNWWRNSHAQCPLFHPIQKGLQDLCETRLSNVLTATGDWYAPHSRASAAEEQGPYPNRQLFWVQGMPHRAGLAAHIQTDRGRVTIRPYRDHMPICLACDHGTVMTTVIQKHSSKALFAPYRACTVLHDEKPSMPLKCEIWAYSTFLCVFWKVESLDKRMSGQQTAFAITLQ